MKRTRQVNVHQAKTELSKLLLEVERGGQVVIARGPALHRDPFDRLLVAQALVEGLSVVSADPLVLAYDVKSIDART